MGPVAWNHQQRDMAALTLSYAQPTNAILAPVVVRGCKHFSTPAVLDIWRNVDAVCFDVDSTVCTEEGIDVLAEHCGAGAAVKEWTTKYVSVPRICWL